MCLRMLLKVLYIFVYHNIKGQKIRNYDVQEVNNTNRCCGYVVCLVKRSE